MWAAVAGSWGKHVEYTDARSAHESELMLDLARRAPVTACWSWHAEPADWAWRRGASRGVGRGGPVRRRDRDDIDCGRAQRRNAGSPNTRTRVLDLESIDEPDPHVRRGALSRRPPVHRRAARAPSTRLRGCSDGWDASHSRLGTARRQSMARCGARSRKCRARSPMPPPGMPGPSRSPTARSSPGCSTKPRFADVTCPGYRCPCTARRSTSGGPEPPNSPVRCRRFLASLEPAAAAALRSRADARSLRHDAGRIVVRRRRTDRGRNRSCGR